MFFSTPGEKENTSKHMSYENLMYDWFELPQDQGEKIQFAPLKKLNKLDFKSHSVCIVRLEDGIHAIHNICPHAGAALHKGHCNNNGTITCPLHHYKFDIKTGRATDGSGYNIKKYRFKKENDRYYLGVRK